MAWQAFTTKWFAVYEIVLGLLLLGFGGYLACKPGSIRGLILYHSTDEKPPPVVRSLLKYFFLFTLPCLVFSFYPFSWVELLFSLWSLVVVYLIGAQLVRWTHTRRLINGYPQKAQKIFRNAGAGMVAVSLLIFVLAYFMIQKLVAF